MARVKRGTTKLKSRKNTLEQTKGYRFGRSTKKRMAYEAIVHAGNNAFGHRKDKKGDFRRLWTVRINAAVRVLGFSYSRFIDALHKKEIGLDRKVLSQIAQENPESFNRIVEQAK
ncbi:50S ribosomal protein L20 [Candidatus Kaiserbacteria bacterium]|nr:50S ribosomal protein L20 [Candidatus Kaiserbacteria bacterium]